jgi:hypothetical protein
MREHRHGPQAGRRAHHRLPAERRLPPGAIGEADRRSGDGEGQARRGGADRLRSRRVGEVEKQRGVVAQRVAGRRLPRRSARLSYAAAARD